MIKSDHDYRVIELNGFRLPEEVLVWLKENVREGQWFYKHPKIYFEETHDHLMFTLRWS